MTANRSGGYTVGTGICKIGLILIALGFFVQILDNFFYRQSFDRLFGLGAAFILTIALCRTLHVMELKEARSAGRRVRDHDLRERLAAATYPDQGLVQNWGYQGAPDIRRDSQSPGEPSDEQRSASALVTARRRPTASGSVCSL